jgi:gamma-glutamylcyclotransferase (GGCT)/AIG2-like uncharacterized protein YtfP
MNVVLDKKVPRLIAVYGTLRKGWGNHRLIADAEFVGKGKTKEDLVLTQSGIPYVSRQKVGNPDYPASKVTVEIYRVTDPWMMNSLDSLEGHPEWYFRSPVEVELEDGNELVAEIYLNERSVGRPNASGDFGKPIFSEE